VRNLEQDAAHCVADFLVKIATEPLDPADAGMGEGETVSQVHSEAGE
jgi:hypothetical protein